MKQLDKMDLKNTSVQTPVNSETGIYDIKWSMIDKKKYFPLTVANMLAVRTLLYPLSLIRTRLQAQTSHSLYSGTFNALTTIVKYEGMSALYKGYWVNSFQLIPHVFYITSYEVNSTILISTNFFFS